MKQRFHLAIILLFFVGLASACSSGSSNPDPVKEAIIDEISAAVRSTATARAAAKLNPNASVETAQAKATASGQSLDATQVAQASLSEDARSATATAFAPFAANLAKYGVDPSQGRPGWVHPPVTLDIDGYMQYDYTNQFISTVARDFVISSDITWNTQYGSSGCGFVLRSDGNKDALNQYLTIATRGASGHVVFATMSNGKVVKAKDIYAYGIDPKFDWRNDTTNRLTVVGRGNLFSIYSNDTLIGEVDPGTPLFLPAIPAAPQIPADAADAKAMNLYKQQVAEHEAVATQIVSDFRVRQGQAANAETLFERGFIALVVLSESGHSVCTFDNTWLWLIE